MNHNTLHLPFAAVAFTEQKKSLRSSPNVLLYPQADMAPQTSLNQLFPAMNL